MRYLIIGLGIYGSNLAVDLTKMGHEVIGADINESIVDSIKDFISTAYIIDSTDATSLKMLPLGNSDVVIVTIGENFGASIRTVALLKSLDIKHIYARAIDRIHEAILEGFGIDRIITPEQRAAKDLVHELELGGDVATLALTPDVYVLRFLVPDFFVGLKYSDIAFEKDYKLKLVAATRKDETTNLVGMKSVRRVLIDLASAKDIAVESGDELTCVGSSDAYISLCRRIN